MQKLERLLNLTAVLLHTARPLPAGELRQKVPGYPESDVAFRRSFERDKDDLREMGVPIEVETVPGADPPVDGYRIPRDRYYLPDPGLEPDELAALQLAAAAIRIGDGTGREALWSLGGDRPTTTSAISAALPSDPNLGPLFEAVSTRSPVRFTYREQDRSIHPYRLGFQLGRWYLRGHDLDRDDVRVFRLDRIDGEVEVDAPGRFEIPDGERDGGELVADRWELGSEPPRVARLLVDADQAPIALAQFDPEDIVAEHPDGSIEVAITVTDPQAFRSLALSYLDHAEILEPAELRAELISWLERIAVGEETAP